MQDDHLLAQRYTRQMVLPAVGLDGQDIFSQSHVVILGLGGLGCPAAQYLTAAGIGQLTLVDPDRVDLTNLPRQILYTENQIGQYKSQAAIVRLQALNQQIKLTALTKALSSTELTDLFTDADLILDCTDTFYSRDLINRASLVAKKPLISAAAIQWSLQVVLLNTTRQAPCYACLFGSESAVDSHTDRCADLGVLGPVVGIAGSLQAGMALHYLLDNQAVNAGQLTLFDLQGLAPQTIHFNKDPACPVCSKTPSIHW